MTSWYSHTGYAPRKALRVGDVARALDVSIPTIRTWSEQFPIPISRLGGQRRYPQKAVNRLRLVKFLLRHERYSLEGARKRYEELISCNW
jgi:DNA-binding transcriptional MerR regulator